MHLRILFFLVSVSLVSCNSAQTILFESQDVVSGKSSTINKKQSYSDEDISAIFSNRNWNHMDQTNLLKIYSIEYIKVNDSPLEFARKLVFIKAIKAARLDSLMNLIQNPTNYTKIENQKLEDFTPTKQLTLCASECDLSIFLDPKNNTVSFFNLAGQDYKKINNLQKEKILTLITHSP